MAVGVEACGGKLAGRRYRYMEEDWIDPATTLGGSEDDAIRDFVDVMFAL